MPGTLGTTSAMNSTIRSSGVSRKRRSLYSRTRIAAVTYKTAFSTTLKGLARRVTRKPATTARRNDEEAQVRAQRRDIYDDEPGVDRQRSRERPIRDPRQHVRLIHDRGKYAVANSAGWIA
jgi:hypothetical protein